MNRSLAILVALGSALALAQPHAQADDGPSLQAVAELGRLNGQALACRDLAAAQRAKALMIELAPKTAAYGSAFDEATQRSFLAQTGGAATCPEPARALAEIDTAAMRLRSQAAALPHAPIAEDSELPLHSMPRYLLQGPRGQAVTGDDFRGRFQLVSFGFTSCPDVCPATLLEMQQVLVALGESASRLQPVFITVDPQRDTLAVLAEYTRAFDARILGLGGSEALVRRAAESFRVRYRKVQQPGAAPEAYTVEHSAGMFLLGPDGQLLERFGYGTTVREMSTRIGRWFDAATQ